MFAHAGHPMSRATGQGMGAYAREISFYQELAGRIEEGLPRCSYAAIDGDGWFTLVLEDIVGAQPGDQIAGCGVDDARLAVRALARVHAPVLGDPHLGAAPWLNQPSPLNQALLEMLLPGFLERYADRITPEHAEVCKRFVAAVDAWAEDRRAPLGLVHGDYRLDNLLFDESSCLVVDWQTVSWGPAMLDVSYFIGGGLPVEDRRAIDLDSLSLLPEPGVKPPALVPSRPTRAATTPVPRRRGMRAGTSTPSLTTPRSVSTCGRPGPQPGSRAVHGGDRRSGPAGDPRRRCAGAAA